MTELTITPKVSDKTARFKGTIAAGEHVAVTIKGGSEWIGEDEGANLTLRVIDLVTKRTLAVFPRPPEVMDAGAEPDAWDSSGDDLTCTLNLNTTRMVNAARHMLRVPVMFVLGDTDAPRTLYFRDQHEVEYWPERIGDDVPYDLDAWPKQIDEWMELVDEWTDRMNEFNATLSGHVWNGGIHVTAEQKTAWTNKQDAIADLEAIREGAGKGATAIQEHQDMSGKADLVGGKVPQSQLPSYVDDVLEYAALANFPATGEEGKIYVAKDTNKTYRWSGTGYVQVGGSDIPADLRYRIAEAGYATTGARLPDNIAYVIADGTTYQASALTLDGTATYMLFGNGNVLGVEWRRETGECIGNPFNVVFYDSSDMPFSAVPNLLLPLALADRTVNLVTAEDETSLDIELPSALTVDGVRRARDLIVDVDNFAGASDVGLELASDATAYLDAGGAHYLVAEADGDDLADLLTVAVGTRARLYFTETALTATPAGGGTSAVPVISLQRLTITVGGAA